MNATPVSEKPCQHLAGCWIARGSSFRCHGCGHQLRLSDLMPRRDRRIEVWRAAR